MRAIQHAIILAANPTTQRSSVASVIGWSLVLIVLVIAAFFVVMRVKNWLTEDHEEVARGPGFSLSDLRELHRAGKMTDEEFELAKNQILSGAKAMTSKMPDPLARPGAAPTQRPRPARPAHVEPIAPPKPADTSAIPLDPPPPTPTDTPHTR